MLHQNTSGLLDETAPAGHVDIFPFQLGVEAYVEDVPPRSGGLLVLPGSHRSVFHHFDRQYSFTPADRWVQVAGDCCHLGSLGTCRCSLGSQAI